MSLSRQALGRPGPDRPGWPARTPSQPARYPGPARSWELEGTSGAGSFLLGKPKFASRRNDKAFVQKAVERSCDALKHAGPELKKDREIVLAAVQQDGRAFEYVDLELKNDPELCCLANP